MDKSLDLGVDYGSTDVLADVLTDDLADDRCQTQCFCLLCYAIRMPERCCSASPLHVMCAVYPESTEFQWYDQLSKEIQPSP